jgi:excisionase family DNA binding protein
MPGKYCHTKEAAKRVGISAITLRRWFREGKIDEVTRDRKGWRIFTEEDIDKIRKYATKTYAPPAKPQTE